MVFMLPGTRDRLLTERDIQGPEYDRGELWDGVWVVREPTGWLPGAIGTRVGRLLDQHVQPRALGQVTDSNTGFTVRRSPDRVLSPDVAFVSRERMGPSPGSAFLPAAPDLAVEIVSPSDRWSHVVAKAEVWLRHGSSVVWVIDPGARAALVLRADGGAQHVTAGGSLDAAPALPGFSVPLADVFAGIV